jgi:hypothetical protein
MSSPARKLRLLMLSRSNGGMLWGRRIPIVIGTPMV